MKYASTRGVAPVLDFGDVLLAGLASDGGLYVPETWPSLGPDALVSFAGRPYAEVAVAVMAPFVEGSLDRDRLAELVDAAVGHFDHEAVTPLVQVDERHWLLELFHGPTLAFKDLALQLVGRLFDHELARRAERATIVVATSGDTGSAAIEACRGRSALDIVVLHPAGRVSDVQRRQMTTVDAPNVHNLAVDGTFDDCQDLVKALFADPAFRSEHRLAAMNSINWGRVMAQVVYYVMAAVALGAPERLVAFSVPTGNFGNVLAGWVARRMGLPVRRLVVASNRNDILTRFLANGTMAVAPVHPTLSPSMDIQVSSNVERLLFELHDRDGAAVAELMTRFRAEGSFTLERGRQEVLAGVFTGTRLDDDDTRAVMADSYRRFGLLVDPHTAVALGGARAVAPTLRPDVPVVSLATAHPAKFPDAVEEATGVRPSLPPDMADLLTRPEHCTAVPNDLDAVRRAVAAASSSSS